MGSTGAKDYSAVCSRSIAEFKTIYQSVGTEAKYSKALISTPLWIPSTRSAVKPQVMFNSSVFVY